MMAGDPSDRDHSGPAAPFRLGEWTVHPARHRIERDGEEVGLEPRVMDVLMWLVEADGRVVSRDELLAGVWSDVVVNDEALSRAVSELRKALGDHLQEPRYIETIRKGGYRLVGKVQPLWATPPPKRPPRAIPWRPLGIAAAGLAVVALLAWMGLRGEPEPEVSGTRVRPITTYPEREIDPAISPDGERVAFIWNGGEGAPDYELYVKQVDGGDALRLTRAKGFEGHPVWSPDGSQIAFVRQEGTGAILATVGAVGGAERKLATLTSWSYGLDWSPDGRWIAFSESKDGAPARIFVLSAEDGKRRRLTKPAALFRGDFKPTFSPDSSRVAFIRGDRVGTQDIHVVSTRGRGEKRLTRDGRRVRGLDWAPDGEIVFCWDRGGEFALWRLDPGTGSLAWMPLGAGPDIFNPSVSADGRRIVVEAVAFDQNIWRAELGRTPVEESVPLISSTRQDMGAVYSPDGRHIAFISNRSGSPELWRVDADGRAELRLSDLGGPFVAAPRWSPDGEVVAVSVGRGEFTGVNLIDAESGIASPRIEGDFHAVPVGWLESSGELIYGSDRDGEWSLWAVPRVDGDSRRFLRGVDFDSAAIRGDEVYFQRRGETAVYRLAAEGNEAERLPVEISQAARWLPVAEGILVVEAGRDASIVSLSQVDLTGRSLGQLGTVEDLNASTLALSPDGKYLLHGRIDRADNDLMLIELSTPSP